MTAFVVDCSVTMSWCFEDESDAYSESVLESLELNQAIVPAIWQFEVVNVLLTAHRRGRIELPRAGRFLQDLGSLPISVEQTGGHLHMDALMLHGDLHKLTAYDAAYLELARRHGIPLATKDAKLQKACLAAKIKPYNPRA